MRIRIKEVSLLSIVVSIILIGTCWNCGCTGIAPLWSQANPTTKIGFKPAVGSLEYFDNSGKGVKAKKLKGQLNGASIEAEDLEITDRSVENREANSAQLAQANLITQTAFNGMSNMFSALGVTLSDVIQEARTPKERVGVGFWEGTSGIVLIVAGAAMAFLLLWKKL